MSNAKLLSYLCMLSFVCLFCNAPALGDMVAEHVGSVDPITEGWVHRTNPGDGGSVGSVAGAWQIIGAEPGIHYYQQSIPDSAFVDGWKLTATLEALSSPYYTSTNSGGVSLQVDDGGGSTGHNWILCLIDDTDAAHPGGIYFVDRSSGTSTVTLLYEMDVTSIHTYNMLYDPLTDPDALTVWVDGVGCGTITDTQAIGANVEGPYTNWGDAGIWPGGTSNWSYVSFETLTVPTPSAILLGTIGLGMASRKLRRRRPV